jgi:hypothetical protein
VSHLDIRGKDVITGFNAGKNVWNFLIFYNEKAVFPFIRALEQMVPLLSFCVYLSYLR